MEFGGLPSKLPKLPVVVSADQPERKSPSFSQKHANWGLLPVNERRTQGTISLWQYTFERYKFTISSALFVKLLCTCGSFYHKGHEVKTKKEKSGELQILRWVKQRVAISSGAKNFVQPKERKFQYTVSQMLFHKIGEIVMLRSEHSFFKKHLCHGRQ